MGRHANSNSICPGLNRGKLFKKHEIEKIANHTDHASAGTPDAATYDEGWFIDSVTVTNTVATPATFSGWLDFGGLSVTLAPGSHLSLPGTRISGAIAAQGNELRFENWSYLENCTLDDGVLPPFAFDFDQQRASLDFLRRQRDAGTTIIPGHDAEADDAKAHDGATGEGDLKRLAEALAGGVGGADVRLGGDFHADIAGSDGDGSTEQECDGGVDAFARIGCVGVVNQYNNDCGKTDHEDGQKFIFLLQEGHGAVCNGAVDEFKAFGIFLFQTHVQRYAGNFLHVKESNSQAQ